MAYNDIYFIKCVLWLCLQGTLRQALDAGLLVNNPYHVILVSIDIHYFMLY
jgi:hypothetical protein